jgi:hypothetical protein
MGEYHSDLMVNLYRSIELFGWFGAMVFSMLNSKGKCSWQSFGNITLFVASLAGYCIIGWNLLFVENYEDRSIGSLVLYTG